MAPNLAVRSESWLDLTCHATSRQEPLAARGQSEAPNKAILSFNRSTRHSFGGSSTVASVGNKQEHLLIRLRQRSYLMRSNSASLSSNLSNSVELYPSLAGAASETAKTTGCHHQATSGLRREPIGLRSFRDRLEARSVRCRQSSRRGSSQPRLDLSEGDKAAAEEQLGPAFARYQLGRSLSSLSERLGDKLSHISHSWKHFLANYNGLGLAQLRSKWTRGGEGEGAQEVGAEAENWAGVWLERIGGPEGGRIGEEEHSLSSIKRRLTVDWVKQHGQRLPAKR